MLSVRENELEKAELKLAESQQKVLGARKRLDELKQGYVHYNNALEKVLTGALVLDVNLITSYKNYILFLEKETYLQKQTIKQLEEVREELRKEMMIVRQKKIMLDKIKEKEQLIYRKEMEYIEMRDLDELSSSRYKKD